MAVSKPSTNPDWCTANPTDATSGQPAIIEPSAGKKASGFLRLEKPSRQDFNWWMNLVNVWVTYFETLTDSHEDNLVQEIASASKPTDLTAGNTVLQTALEAKYLSDDFLEGFRILDVSVSAGPDVSIKVSKGSAWVADEFYTQSLRLRSNSYGGGSAITKKFIQGGSLASYAYGDGNGGVGSAVIPIDESWYHVFVVYNATNQAWDIGISDDPSGADIIFDSGNIGGRRVASLYYVNSTIGFRSVKQFGDYFFYDKMHLESGGGIHPTISINGTGSIITSNPSVYDLVPPVDVLAKFTFSFLTSGNPNGCVILTSSVEGDLSTADPNYFNSRCDFIHLSAGSRGFKDKDILVDGQTQTITQFSNLVSGGSMDIEFTCLGYTDLRGKNWGTGISSPNNPGLYLS